MTKFRAFVFESSLKMTKVWDFSKFLKFKQISKKIQKIPKKFLKIQKNFSKNFKTLQKFFQNFTKTQTPPPSLYFQCFEALFFALFWARAWKNLQIFSAKDIFCAIILLVFEFAWQTNGKFGTEFAISLLRQAKSESKARFACHTER